MVFDPNVAIGAGERWNATESGRRRIRRKLADDAIAEIEPPERIRKRLAHLEQAAAREARTRALIAQRPADLPAQGIVESIGLERIIGKDDRLGMDFLELAVAVARTVARVRLRSGPTSTDGYGTGFLVSPRLLLTNHHVLEGPEIARHSEAELDYQVDRYGRQSPAQAFRLEPETFFLADEGLDYALVAVAERSVDGQSTLESYGWNRLVGEEGKALLGDHLNIIQHPRGGPKQIVLRQNQLIGLLDDFAHYLTDTERGSSGAPVFNDQWEVVALHHSGVPRVEDGQIMATDGHPWESDMGPEAVDWVANEGVRASSLVAHIEGASLAPGQRVLRNALLEAEPPDLVEKAFDAMRTSVPTAAGPAGELSVGAIPGSTAVTVSGGKATWTIPLRITIDLGRVAAAARPVADGGVAEPPAARPAPVPATETPSPAAAEGVSIDPDYDRRKGYDPAFLGDGEDRHVRIPKLSEAQYAQVAFNQNDTSRKRHILRYHHFSVVMNGTRRLAFFTAVNIDGKQAISLPREDAWYFDPRIPEDAQAGNDIYASNPLDRGHLVRRLDPTWGETDAVARLANDDTFHWTNCAPQHQSFNRNQTVWAGIENYVLRNAKAHDLKVSAFCGPVFRDDDPQYRDIALPQQFWKVVALVREDGSLSATGYLLSQAQLLDAMLEEDFAYGAYRTYQRRIREIEQITGLYFRGLHAHDPLETQAPDVHESAGARGLVSLDDLIL